METLQNHLQELASVTIDSEWLKDLVDLGSGAVKTVTGLTKAFGGLNTIIGAIAGILLQKSGFGLFSFDKLSGQWTSFIGKIKTSRKILQETKTGINNWMANQGLSEGTQLSAIISADNPLGIGKQLDVIGMNAGLRDYIKNLDEATRSSITLGQAIQGYYNSMSIGTKIAKGFSNVLHTIGSTVGTMLIMMAASKAISAIFTGISDAIITREESIKAGKEASSKASSSRSEIQKIDSAVKAAQDRYNKLRKGVYMNGNTIQNLSLSADEYAEFLDINQQLGEVFPGLITGINDTGQALVDLGGDADAATQKLTGFFDAAKQIYINDIEEQMPKIVSGLLEQNESFDKSIEEAEKQLTSYQKVLDTLSDINSSGDYSVTIGDKEARESLEQYLSNSDIYYDASVLGTVDFSLSHEDYMRFKKSKEGYENQVYGDIQRVQNKIDSAEKERQSNWNKEFVPNLTKILEADPNFLKMGDEMTNLITSKLTEIDWNSFFSSDAVDYYDSEDPIAIAQQIIEPIELALSEGKVDPIDIGKVLNFDWGNATNEEITDTTRKVLETLFPNEEIRQQVAVAFDIMYEDENGFHYTVTKERNDFYEMFGGKVTGYDPKTGKYTRDDSNARISWNDIMKVGKDDRDFILSQSDLGNVDLSTIKDYDQLIAKINELREVSEEAGAATLSDVLNDETFQTDTSKTESHISALSSALDNFRESGELTTEQLHDLQKEVPELAELGDSLTMEDVGDKLWENIGDYATKFHEAMDRMDLSDEGKIQGQNFLNSFFDQFVDIPVSEKNAKKALHDFFVDTEATSAETAAQRGVEENRYKKVIDALTEKYGEDIDWSVVMSILADPSLAEATTEEFIAAVDSQEATVKIRADIDQAKADLDKFVENAEADIGAQEAYIAKKQAKTSTGDFAKEFREASVNGTDLTNTVFGNIDVANRQVLKWTKETIAQNEDVLRQWDAEFDPKNYLGTSSTIFGAWENYGDEEHPLNIAFSPMLQTDNGPELLSPDTVNEYMYALFDKANEQFNNNWTTKNLLGLDSRGLEINGKKIHGLIADVGDTAPQTSMIMHDIGAPFTTANQFRVTEADYAPIIQNRRNIADETAGYYQYLLDKYDYVKEHGANEAYLNNLSKQIADAQTKTENRQADLYNAVKESREADLNWNNTLLEHHQAIGENLESERTRLENDGKVVTHELAEDIAGNRRSQIQAQQAVLNENNRLYENTGEVQYLQNMVAARNAIEDIKSLGTTADQVIWESQVTNLGNSLTALEATATTIQDAITLQEGQGLKPTIDQYQRLVKNGKDQVANLEKQNYYLSRQQNRLTANSARWREIGAQINSNNSAIASMNGNINNWQDNLRNFAGDMGQSLLSALQAAFDESNSPTGLQFSTMKELAAQFEGIEGFDFADIFYNTAQGVKLDADATERLVDAQYQLMTGDLTKRINSQNAALQNLRQTYRETTDASEKANLSMQIDAGEANLNNMYNQLAQYQALYSQAQRQLFSDYGAWQRAQSSENAGATYSSIQGYLATQEQAYKDGLIGTDEFKTYTALFDQWGRDTLKAYTENREKMQRYLTEDASGVANVLTDLVSNGFGTYDEETMRYDLDLPNLNKAASSIGVSEEFLDYALQRTEDYGFTTDYVRDQIQGELKLSDLVQQTGEAIKKRNELIADGAPQEVIDEYNDKIAQLDQSTENVEKNIQRVVANAGKISASEVKAAVDTINEYKKRANEATTDQQREAYMRQIQNVADEAGIELDELGNIDYVKLNKQYDGWEHADKNAKAVSDITDEQIESVKLEGESIENNETLQSGLGKLKNGWEANTKKVQDYVNTLKDANIDDLMALDLNDGNVVNGLEAEEAALDGLVNTFGLTADEAKLLVPILQELGVLGSETLYNKPGAQGTLGVDVGAAQNYLEAHSAIGLTADDLVFDAANMSLDELQAKMDQLSQAKGMVRIEEQGGPEALAQLEQLEAECQKEYNIKVGIQNLNEMGMSIDEFLGKSKDEQIEIMAKLGIEEENYDAFVARIESNPVRAKIETALSDGSKSVEDLIGLTDEELIAEVGCEASEVDEVRAELEEMAANEYDVKVAINDASIAEIGKSVAAAINGEEYTKEVKLEATGQDEIKEEATKTETKHVNVVYNVIQKAKNAISGLFGGNKDQTQTKTETVTTTANTSQAAGQISALSELINKVKATAQNIALNITTSGALSQVQAIKTAVDNIKSSASEPINIQANNEQAISSVEEVVSTAEGASPEITIGGNNSQAISSVNQAVSHANSSSGRITINGNNSGAISAINQAVASANGRTAKITIDGNADRAISAAQSAVSRIRSMIANISISAHVSATVTGTVVKPSQRTNSSNSGGHANYHSNTSNTGPKPGTKYSGSLSSIGRGYAKGTFDEDGKVAKSGSAYNMLNYKDMSGFARGDIAIDKDQESLINELGTESIIYRM